jgi:hypothetical protein
MPLGVLMGRFFDSRKARLLIGTPPSFPRLDNIGYRIPDPKLWNKTNPKSGPLFGGHDVTSPDTNNGY